MTDLLKSYWQKIEPRDRVILAWGGAIVSLILFYALIWQPWHNAISEMQERIQPRRESLVWMQQQAEWVQSGGLENAAQKIRGADQSLMSVLEQTARSAKVRESIQQMIPSAENDEVRVVLEDANFNQWLKWIDVLFKQYGVGIKQMSAERDEDAPNVAEIRITFER